MGDFGMTAAAQASRIIAAKPADIWQTLTSGKKVKACMIGADVETDWRVGGPITLRGEINGERFEDTGEVRSFLPERRLSYTHPTSAAAGRTQLVTIELQRRGAETEVTVIQENLTGVPQPADTERWAEFEKTWAQMLEGLEKAVAH